MYRVPYKSVAAIKGYVFLSQSTPTLVVSMYFTNDVNFQMNSPEMIMKSFGFKLWMDVTGQLFDPDPPNSLTDLFFVVDWIASNVIRIWSYDVDYPRCSWNYNFFTKIG